MGNAEKTLKLREIEQVFPQTAEEKANMKKPYINKPVPDMYFFRYLVCNSKSVKNISTVPVDYLKSNLSVMAPMKELSSNLSSLWHRTKRTFCVFAREARKNLSVITLTNAI